MTRMKLTPPLPEEQCWYFQRWTDQGVTEFKTTTADVLKEIGSLLCRESTVFVQIDVDDEDEAL